MRDRQTLHLRGVRVSSAEPSRVYDLPEQPRWYFSAERPCSPDKGKADLFVSEQEKDRNVAKKMCEPCPFREKCQARAVKLDERNFVWGGFDFSATNERKLANGETPVAAVRSGDDIPFRYLEPSAQARIIRAALTAGDTYTDIARRYQWTISDLQKLLGDAGATLDDRVKALHGEELTDVEIAGQIGCSPNTVWTSRQRQGLPALYGGRRRDLAEVTS